ncbi:hypothetical protein TTHERM_00129180 (macronuclear) [Tetrahymena thermophila SB210]|uniref:Uncharacterized protein n=1 Tax=Tetrahymena thermophila (strain SB210) TaxID=312017 RepID=I7M7W7_TETTS|nr:hypothetical protein TTHERM_00129180 [Tetrahymena thermophila SB210]EAR96147.1 hypothetical protein TTHERM_00129180 [Tetrahymena thermophila SB210]|eukprot:XP_001016392.1 hypothetical protein TTHERM_00129180 [Tetrahymena thermophila SB210]
MATKVGLEPTTFRLEVCCATIAPLGFSQYKIFEIIFFLQINKLIFIKNGNQGGTRTHNLQIRSLLRYHCATRLQTTNYQNNTNTFVIFVQFISFIMYQ